jgi:gamma-glutamyl hercynylcysteine S-oxide synthase
MPDNLPSTTSLHNDSVTVAELAEWVLDSRDRTFDVVADLTDEQLIGPRLAIVNPLLWEIGHTAWFQEKWVLRHVCGEAPIRSDADALYDSMAIPHDTRWDLPLPSREATFTYMREVRDRVLDRLHQGRPSDALLYFVRYCVHHDDMHNEAFTYTRQTLGYAAPRFSFREADEIGPAPAAGALPGDVVIPGGEFMLGGPRTAPFVFDNEKWEHPVQVRMFEIARAPVTQSAFAEFAEDGGYLRRDLWSSEGWQWRERGQVEQPAYWKRDDGARWLRRNFSEWLPLEPHLPVIHVNWHEAEAYCRWAGRRLPTEAEWEAAAACDRWRDGLLASKRNFPWSDDASSTGRANLDWRTGGCLDVAALPAGDSAFGCRQMIGNVWEWTSSPFLPYPGFVPDAYKEYSEPWLRTHVVLRGGCWATRSRLIRNTYRNFYMPDRRDVWAGFRTCKLSE